MESKTDRRGMILTDNVDLHFLASIEPRYSEDFCKFVIHKAQNKVCVGAENTRIRVLFWIRS